MANEATKVAPTKRARISEAQKYMLLSVLVASIFLGVALALVVHFVQQINFNKEILMAEDESIANYSNAIKTTGVCAKPKGATYSDSEIEKCNPSSLTLDQIPDTLRYNVLNTLARDTDLNSVTKEASSNCRDPSTNKDYTYDQLKSKYDEAVRDNNAVQSAYAGTLLKTCSALRIIPDALPSVRNEEALLASLNKLFIESNHQPEALSPGGNASSSSTLKGMNALSVNVSVEADSAVTMSVLHNIERSIRDFDIERATIEWSGEDTLTLQAQATAYYVDESSIVESNKTIKAGGD